MAADNAVLSAASTPTPSGVEVKPLKIIVGDAGFSFDCGNTPDDHCRRIVAADQEKSVRLEPSSVVWSKRFQRAIAVNDNYNDLVEQNAARFVIMSFSLDDDVHEIQATPMLTADQALNFPLYDLEGVALSGDRLYAIGSLALRGKDPERDRWERHQFVQAEVQGDSDALRVAGLSHLSRRWPNFRDWLISKSGYQWTSEALRGRAEGEGINVEALSATRSGNLLIGFRGPLTPEGGSLVLEIRPPADPDKTPELVKTYSIPAVNFSHIPGTAPKTLRGMIEIADRPGEFYVLLGPKGYEKESVVLARWHAGTGQLTKATVLPEGFVAEGVTRIAPGRLLIVDDLDGMLLIASEK